MIYTARLEESSAGYLAECMEIDATGRGETRAAALAALREELEDRLGHVEGVAPPAEPPAVDIEIVVVDEVAARRFGG